MKRILIITLSLLLCLCTLTSCGNLIRRLFNGDDPQAFEETSGGANRRPTNNPQDTDDLPADESTADPEESKRNPNGVNEGSNETSNDESREDHEHSFGDWTVTREPDCTAKGEKERVCSCGDKETEKIDALGHDEITHEAKTPTCSEAGWDAYVTCSRCNFSTYSEKYAPHDFKAEYSLDSKHHWRECSACGAASTKEAHKTDSNGYCRICNQSVNSTAGIEYALSSSKTYAEVVGYNGTESRVVIASVFEGVPVRVIADNAFKDKSITAVTIPSSVERIGERAFSGCSSLKSITIPESVTSIAQFAFYNCSSLEEMILPYVGENRYSAKNAFLAYIFGANGYSGNSSRYVPTSLKKVTVTGNVSIEDGAFYSCANIQSVEFAGNVTSIGKYSFYGCTGIVSIELPDSVKSIGNFAFQNCSRLKNIDLGKGVTEITGNAFEGCTAIVDITIPESVTAIGSGAFKGCTSIREITVPGSVESIGDGAFRDCTGLQKITIPFVGEKADGTGFTHFGHIFGAGGYRYHSTYIPASLRTVVIMGGESIAANAFRDCKNFTDIVIPKSVTSIGEMAFSGCDGLARVYYCGTASDWAQISIGSTNDKLKAATFTYNYKLNK